MSETVKKNLWKAYTGFATVLVTGMAFVVGTQVVAYANEVDTTETCNKAMVMVGGSMKPIGPCQ